MGQTDQERQAMNAWKATVSGKVRKDVLKDKADELEQQRDAKKRKAFVESLPRRSSGLRHLDSDAAHETWPYQRETAALRWQRVHAWVRDESGAAAS